MSATLLAKDCPAIQVPSTLTYKATAYSAGPLATLPVSKRIPGALKAITPQVNSNAMGQDLTTEAGGGATAYCIPDGVHRISLSAGSGLQVNVSAGHAFIGGFVEIASATSLAVINSPRLWIWLSQSGALNYSTDTTPPSATCVMLGSCVAAGGNVQLFDTSCVMYLRGASLWRESADTGEPGDSPPSSVAFFHRSNGDGTLWYWDGTAYTQIASAEASLQGQLWDLQEQLEAQSYYLRALVNQLVIIGIDDILGDEALADLLN